ncbi:MAG: iron ABC transporter permease [Dehalococcoidales bacterium]|nr:iron ABC transporter permease [Dehalococcoidales bacterium]
MISTPETQKQNNITSERDTDEGNQGRREKTVLIVLLVLLIISAFVSLCVGRFGIPVDEIISIFQSWITGKADLSNNPSEVVILLVRLPRIMLCILVGAALSASGASYQGLFRNPMVSPDILGVAAGAGVGASIAILMDYPSIMVQIMAFIFGIGAVFLVMALASAMGKGNPVTLIMVLSGIVIGSLFNSCTALIKFLADAQDRLPDVVFWLMGSFAKCGSYSNVLILVGVVLLAGIPLYLTRWQMNVLAFGEEEAQAIGINTGRLRLGIVICSTLLTASSIAMCGMIGWVGLVIPHITRFLVGPNFKVLLPTSMVLGALFMIIVDDLARTVISGEIPVGVITSIVGAPLFIYLMFKGRRTWV